MRGLRALIVGVCGLAVTACASAPPSADALANNDPYERTNREIFQFNNTMDRLFLVPTARNYIRFVPDDGRRAIHNLLGNLALPTIFINDVLQGEARRGSQTAGRFLVNTTLGLGGFFDPANRLGIPGHGEDMGQTFAVWGAEEGPYLMLPLLGPSNPRDTVGLATDTLIDPTNFIHFKQHIWWSGAREYMTLLDLRTQALDTLEGIQRNSVDYYASLRGLYRQLRAEQIRNGKAPAAQDLPDL